MQKIKIMIVGDHRLITEGIADVLRRERKYTIVGSQIKTLHSIRRANRRPPDVAILDVNKNTFSGLDTAAHIMNNAPDIKLLIISDDPGPMFAKKVLQAGALGYLTRTSPTSELIEAITTVCSGRKYVCRIVRDIIASDVLAGKNPFSTRHGLTKREKQIIRLVLEGATSRMIAERLQLALKTVEFHRGQILKKLNVKNSAQLANHVHPHLWEPEPLSTNQR